MGVSFADVAEYHRTKCDHYFGCIAYPLIEEAASGRAREIVKLFAEIALMNSEGKTRVA